MVASSSRISFLYVTTILVAMALSMRSTNNMVSTTVPILAKYTLNFSNLLVGAVAATGYLATLVSTSFINPALYSSLRRKVFIIANFAIVLSLILFSKSNPATVWVASVLVGISFGIVLPNVITSASIHGDARVQERLLSIYSVSLSMSLIVGPAIETFLLSFLDYRDVFLAFIPVSLIGLVLSFFIAFPDVKVETRGRAALNNSGFLSSILSITTYNVPFAAITSFLAIFAIEAFSVSRNVAYSIYLYFFVVSLITRFYMAARPFRYLKLPLITSVVLTVFGLSMIHFANSLLFLIIIVALLGIPHGAIFPMSMIMIARGTNKEERNAVNSYFLAYVNVLFTIVPILFGFLSSYIGYQNSFLVMAIPPVVALILLLKFFGNNRMIFLK